MRPGVSSIQGVGLICIRPVPPNGRICGCSAQLRGETYLESVPGRRLNLMHPAVALAMLELFDGYYPRKGTFQCPTEYDEAIPLVSLINHSDEPNCFYDDESNAIRAKRRLRTGEEAVVDFLQYHRYKGAFTYRDAKDGFTRTPWFWVKHVLQLP